MVDLGDAPAPGADRRRAVAIVAVLVLLSALVVPVISLQSALKDQVSSLEHERAIVGTLAAQLPDLQAQSEALEKSATTAGLLQAAGDANLTQAQAISVIAQLATGAGLRIMSTEARTPVEEPSIRRLPVLVRVSGSDVAIATFLSQAKASKPLLVIQKLALRTDLGPGAGPGGVQAEIVLEALSRKAT